MPRNKIINKRFKKIKFSFFVIFLIFLCGAYINSTTFFRLKLAEHYVKTQNIDKAIVIYNKILRKEELANKYLSLNVNDMSDIYFTLANLYLNKNEFIESVQLLKKISETNPIYKIDFIPNFKDNQDYRRFGLYLARADLYAMSARQFEQYLKTKPDDSIVRYYLALIYSKVNMQDNAIEQFNKIIQLFDAITDHTINFPRDYLVNIYCNLGVIYEEKLDIKKAKDYYKKAINLQKNKAIIAFNNLKDIYEKEGNAVELGVLHDYLQNAVPFYVVNHKFENGALLLGYSMDEREFELFNEGKMVFIWQMNGERIYDIRDVENLALNFGFEMDFVGKGFPYGWGTDIYANNPVYQSPIESHQIVSEKKGLGEIQYLLLDNEMSRCTNCQTNYIAVNDNDFYLQGGRIKAIKGNAYFGRIWFDLEKNKIVYNYVVKGTRSSQWKFYSKIVIPPPNSIYCRLWVVNFENQGKAYFDDILFIKLQLPELIKN